MDILSLLEASLIAHRKPVSLRAAINRGDLKAQKAGPRAWIVLRHDLQDWIDNPAMHKTGAKAK